MRTPPRENAEKPHTGSAGWGVYGAHDKVSVYVQMWKNMTPYVLSEEELDHFLGEFVEAVVDGIRSRVLYGRTLDEMERFSNFFGHRLLMLMRFHVDPDDKRFKALNRAAGRYGNVPSTYAREESVRKYLNEQIELGLRAAWVANGPSEPEMISDDMTEEEEEARLDRNFAEEQRIQRRFEDLFGPIELKLEQARFDAERAIMAANAASLAERKSILINRSAPMPQPQLYGVSPRGAEIIVAARMRHIGIRDAEVTPERADEGVDVASSTHLAQVKHYTGKVSVVEVREIFGVATARNKTAVFFTSNGYTADALTFASAVNMPLFVYGAEQGTLLGVNSWAKNLL